jgi:membrane dipeptidase
MVRGPALPPMLAPVFFCFLLVCSQLAFATEDPHSKAARLHQNSIVIDTHSDFLDRSAIDGSGLADDTIGSQTTLGKLRQGQIDAQFFSVFVPPAYARYGFTRRANELIDRLEDQIVEHSGDLEKAVSVEQIRRIAQRGKIAVLMGVEGGHAIEGSLETLNQFYQRGVRYMTLTWSNTNAWADSSGDVARWSGLNDVGVGVVERMNDLGMMIDISHVSDETFWDVLAITRSPVLASHSGVRAVMDNKRNMGDDMIRAVASNGGVIQVTFYARYVDQGFYDQFKRAERSAQAQFQQLEEKYAHDPVELDLQQWSLELALEREIAAPSARKVVDHIDHIVQLVGIDHVGLGSDFDGMGTPPEGLEHVGKMATITHDLVQRGYSDADIEKVLGGNLLRVFERNEKNARSHAH